VALFPRHDGQQVAAGVAKKGHPLGLAGRPKEPAVVAMDQVRREKSLTILFSRWFAPCAMLLTAIIIN
jgi:hypothetical protein